MRVVLGYLICSHNSFAFVDRVPPISQRELRLRCTTCLRLQDSMWSVPCPIWTILSALATLTCPISSRSSLLTIVIGMPLLKPVVSKMRVKVSSAGGRVSAAEQEGRNVLGRLLPTILPPAAVDQGSEGREKAKRTVRMSCNDAFFPLYIPSLPQPSGGLKSNFTCATEVAAASAVCCALKMSTGMEQNQRFFC